MRKPLTGIALGTLVSTSLFANVMQGQEHSIRSWQWVGEISIGAAWSYAGDTQTFYLSPSVEKSYRPSKSSTGMPSSAYFLGAQKALSSQILGQLGLVLATTGNARLQGIIWDDADPQFDNYSYSYKVRNTRVGIKGSILIDKGYWLIPYVSGSANIGFNRAYNYNNTPLIFEALPNPNFAAHTKTAFSYTLGVGVKKQLNPNWQIGIGYEFLDFGKSQLDRAPGQTVNSGLSLNNLYAHEILISLSYVV